MDASKQTRPQRRDGVLDRVSHHCVHRLGSCSEILPVDFSRITLSARTGRAYYSGMTRRKDTLNRITAGGWLPSSGGLKTTTAAVQIEPRQETGGASFVYRMHPADRFGGDPLARAQHGSGTRARTSTLLPAQDHGGLNDRRLCHRTRVCLGPVPYSSQPGSGDARKIVNCPFRNSAAGVRVPDWQFFSDITATAFLNSFFADPQKTSKPPISPRWRFLPACPANK